jgi:myo-inositol-1(or 4)-monophosphatase
MTPEQRLGKVFLFHDPPNPCFSNKILECGNARKFFPQQPAAGNPFPIQLGMMYSRPTILVMDCRAVAWVRERLSSTGCQPVRLTYKIRCFLPSVIRLPIVFSAFSVTLWFNYPSSMAAIFHWHGHDRLLVSTSILACRFIRSPLQPLAMLDTAIEAALAAGKLLRGNFGQPQPVNEMARHDIKLEIDVRAQETITKVILAAHPDHAILGEEGISGPADADVRWVVDPLDGTVNYFYGIPHYAVSIAAQQKAGDNRWETVAGVVLDPELDELFAATRDGPATLNGTPTHVSDRTELGDAIMSIGFFKSADTIRRSLQDFTQLVSQVRKVRIQGAAALDVAYVACGRYDAYIEYGIKLWDICAGQLILGRAGGKTVSQPGADGLHAFDVRMWNGKIPMDAGF